MLSLARDLVKVRSKDSEQIKPLTVCFWSDFMANPSVMYNLFAATPRKLNYDPDKVKVMGTKDGMINQINVTTVEDLDSIHEELLGVPLLLRIWAEHVQQNEYENQGSEQKWEGDLALLIDTSHPMIRPELERALERGRKILQSGSKFCVQIDLCPAVSLWLKTSYPRGCCTFSSLRSHKAHLYITNHAKPEHCFDCNPLWYIFFGPCWLLTAPCYKLYRFLKCTDIVITPNVPIVRRSILPTGKVVEITRSTLLLLLKFLLETTSLPLHPSFFSPPSGYFETSFSRDAHVLLEPGHGMDLSGVLLWGNLPDSLDI